MDFTGPYKKLARPSNSATSMDSGCATQTAELCSELLNAAVSVHALHLKVSGSGSYAAHKALGEFYDAIPGHADAVAEQYQGATEKLLDLPIGASRRYTDVADCIDHLRTLTSKVNNLQAMMPYSEIVNQLDEIKSLMNTTKYKLIFLQ